MDLTIKIFSCLYTLFLFLKSNLVPSPQAVGDGQQVAALDERLPAEQWLLPGVQLLRLLQPLPPGGGLVDPLGANCQRVGGCAQEEGEAAQGEAETMV